MTRSLRAVLAVAVAVLAWGAGACTSAHPPAEPRPSASVDGGGVTVAPDEATAPAPAAPPPAAEPLPADARLPRIGRVDTEDPTSVARAWATLAYSHDAAYDLGPHDAALRAADYLTPAAAAVELRYAANAGPGARWLTWESHRAWTTVRIVEGHEPRPSDTATTAYRQLQVDGTAHGRDGWRGAGPSGGVFLYLEHDLWEGWRVERVQSYVD